MDQASPLGTEFAQALAAKDVARMRGLMHPEIDFRGLTPGRTWEASDADAAIAVIFGHWFEDGDEIARRRQRPDM